MPETYGARSRGEDRIWRFDHEAELLGIIPRDAYRDELAPSKPLPPPAREVPREIAEHPASTVVAHPHNSRRFYCSCHRLHRWERGEQVFICACKRTHTR